MDYKDKYNKLVEAVKVLQETNPSDEGIQNWVNNNVPELAESENEKIRKMLIDSFTRAADMGGEIYGKGVTYKQVIAWLEKQGQKTAWSEEDEERFQSCLNILQVQAKGFMGITETINTKWLKSLKQRYTWKPSKEQMDAIMDAMQMAVSYFGYSWTSKEQKLLESLYKDLKKLTEG